VVVVSGAAGAVGSLVVQFAKRHGARVLGIAGGPAKCDWLRDALGADWTIDYRPDTMPTRWARRSSA
jgi:NADPH-dependent curcumin reductase CurA